jgi:hypothetical protein
MELHPLVFPSFISGYYGLEESHCRGIIKLHPGFVYLLLVQLKGTLQVNGFPNLQTTLFTQTIDILHETTIESLCSIPFDIPFPKHDQIQHRLGPCPELLPPSYIISHNFSDASVVYRLEATLYTAKPSIFKAPLKTHVIIPLIVYDPRMIKSLLNRVPLHVRTAYESDPIEIDLQFGSLFQGPGDLVHISYKLLLSQTQRDKGVKITNVNFALLEHHLIGEGRCCERDDDYDDLFHIPRRSSTVIKLLEWSKMHFDIRKPYYKKYGRREKAFSVHEVNIDNVEQDGIFCHGVTELRIPERGGFVPTSPRLVIPANDHICKRKRPAFAKISHSFKFTISMMGHEEVVIERGCYLLSVGLKDCDKLLISDAEIVPSFDYEKEIGIEDWVPEYQEVEDQKEVNEIGLLASSGRFHLVKQEPLFSLNYNNQIAHERLEVLITEAMNEGSHYC